MKKSRLTVAGGLLLFTFSIPRASFAISGCNNGYLSGTYNAQVSSAAFSSVITTLNNNAGLTLGLTPNAAPPAAAAANGGLVANGTSLVGDMPSLGRYYFDGNGGIVGLANYVPVLRSLVGSYTVNNDCTLNIKLNSGQTYGGVVVNQGQQVLFIQTDPGAAGLTGTLAKSVNYCAPFTAQQSFGFTYFGANAVTAGAASGDAHSFLTFQPYSAVGTVTVDGEGNFNMTAFSTTTAGVQLQSSTGTYTINGDCSLRLSFNPSSAGGGASTGAFLPPLGFNGLLSSNGNGAAGALSVQNWQGGTATGTVIPQ
jgi:hypothetical protein